LRAHISSRNEIEKKQNVPQDDGTDQRAAGAREKPGILRNVVLQEAPGDDLQRRPIDQLEQPRPRRQQEIPVTQDHRMDAMRRDTPGHRRFAHDALS
jgi:hypothetical protein